MDLFSHQQGSRGRGMLSKGQQDLREILEGLINSLDTQQLQWLPAACL